MCASCGCAHVNDDHGDHRAITLEDLKAAADSANTTIDTVAHNIESVVMHRDDSEASKAAADDLLEARVVKAVEAQRFLLMVGYSPNRLPLRGADGFVDIAAPDVVEKGCWRFMENGARGGLMHKSGGEGAFRVVENSIYRNPQPWVLKAADGSEQVIREGDWLIGVVCAADTWDAYKSGAYGGGSLQGGAHRRIASAETLARQRR